MPIVTETWVGGPRLVIEIRVGGPSLVIEIRVGGPRLVIETELGSNACEEENLNMLGLQLILLRALCFLVSQMNKCFRG